MKPLQTDLSIFNKLKLERPPVGVKYLFQKLEIFQDARANKRLVRQNYGLGKGTVNYVAMAPLDKINFEPDLLILMTTARQGEIVMRAMAYSTGEIYESKIGRAS